MIMTEESRSTVFITGATSIIGEAVARLFAEEQFNLIITGKKQQPLEILKERLEKEYGVEVLILWFDVRDRHAVESAIGSIQEKMRNIEVLVNTAGLSTGLDHLGQGDVLDWELMVDTNIKGLLYIIHNISNIMIERGSGHIINVGSVTGTFTNGGSAVYSATKHAAHALSVGMRADFMEYGIKVTEIRPGFVYSDFSDYLFGGDPKESEEILRGFTPLSGEDIAESVLWAVVQPPHVNIDEIVITPTAKAGKGL